jgi:hypothetical protein
MTTTTLPRTSHRSGLGLAIGLVVAALIVTALLVSWAHSGSSKPTGPVLGTGSAPSPAATATAAHDTGCFAYGIHGHFC